MYSLVTISNDTFGLLEIDKRVDFKCSHPATTTHYTMTTMGGGEWIN